jgi:hypothetical protein
MRASVSQVGDAAVQHHSGLDTDDIFGGIRNK